MFSIALIGPDGCGKTTVATEIEKALPWRTKYVYMGVSLESSNLMLPTSRLKLALRRLFRRPADTVGPRDPDKHDSRPKSRVARAMKFGKRTLSFANQVAEEGYRQAIVRWHLMRRRVVLFDRDFFADYYAYDIAAPNRSIFRRMHGWLLVNVYRKPDLVIYLDVSGETMFARKGEGSVELLNRRRKDYRELRDVMPNFVTVSGEQPLDDVIQEVQRHIGRLWTSQSAEPVGSAARDDVPMAVVIGADCVTGLQTGRAFWRHGIPAVGIATNAKHYCCATKVFQRILACDTGGEALVRRLEFMGPALPSKAVLVPCTDLSVLTLSQFRERLEPWFHVALPSYETVLTFTDKVRFARHAQENGIPFPRSYSLRCMNDVESAVVALTFPCYLKPAVKTKRWEENTNKKAFVVNSADELFEACSQCLDWTDDLLVQEAIVGPETNHYTCDLYVGRDGAVSSSFGSRKLRCWPSETGTACLSVEDDNDQMRDKSMALFRDVSFHGPGYVEFKQDDRTGEYLVVETNVGRPTGRSAASAHAGVELTYAMYCDLVDLPCPDCRQSKSVGRKWIHFRRDLLAATKKWRAGKLSIRAWLRSTSGKKHFAVFSLSDPQPFFSEARRYLKELVLRRGAAKLDCTGDSKADGQHAAQPMAAVNER